MLEIQFRANSHDTESCFADVKCDGKQFYYDEFVEFINSINSQLIDEKDNNKRLQEELAKRNKINALELAKFMHDTYEGVAKQEGWETQEKCRVDFNDLPDRNRLTMLRVAEAVLVLLKKE